MKKIISLLLILTLTTVIACTKQEAVPEDNSSILNENESTSASNTGDDSFEIDDLSTVEHTDNTATASDSNYVDLTSLSSTMVYAEVYNMMMMPDAYVGKTIKMSGVFTVFEDPETGTTYTACLIYDAMACCQQGIEFVLGDSLQYPEDYPAIDEKICVEGVFETYEEGEFTYCHLVDAVLVTD